jgi:hypothetical protein
MKNLLILGLLMSFYGGAIAGTMENQENMSIVSPAAYWMISIVAANILVWVFIRFFYRRPSNGKS